MKNKTFQDKLEGYSKLLIQVGLNVQKDQEVVIMAPIQAVEFVRLLVKEAYEIGAKKVYVDYVDEQISKMMYEYAPDEALQEYPSWLADGKEKLAQRGAAFLSISASNPDLLKEISPKRIGIYQKAAGQALEGYKKYVSSGRVAWCVASIPTPEWSAKVFPNETPERAVERLWEAIFKVNRLDESDPVEAWKKHDEGIRKRKEYLNQKQLKHLYFKGPGTDLKVTLPEGHIWEGGGSTSERGVYYIANMPTEEVFTAPHKYGVEGVLSSTKPLSYGGNLIEEFSLTFKEGKVVDYTAKQGYDSLKSLLETDEGATYLGEVAIVPHSSPVSTSGVIFFNTLFDENASCHFALGNAYPDTLKGGVQMSKEALEEAGMNTSITHVDFMVGGPKLCITGEDHNGESFKILENGEWHF